MQALTDSEHALTNNEHAFINSEHAILPITTAPAPMDDAPVLTAQTAQKAPAPMDDAPALTAQTAQQTEKAPAPMDDAPVLTAQTAAVFRVWEGVLYAKGDVDAAFAKNGMHILRLFCLAAKEGLAVECDTLCAALRYADAICALPPYPVRDALQEILLSQSPEALGPLLAAGALLPYGIGQPCACTSSLARLPCTMLARWWGVLRITRAHSTALCEKLCFHPSFAQDLQALDTFAQSPPPQNGTQLKIRLAAADFKDEREAIAAVAAMGKEFAAVLPLHEALLACGEPYRTAQLAIGKAALCTLGFAENAQAQVLWELQLAVIRAPALNNVFTLTALAKHMRKFV